MSATRPGLAELAPAHLPDGVLAVVKRSCPTCSLVAPVLAQLAGAGVGLTVWVQDDPSFPPGVAGVVDDTGLELSYRLGVTTVPTLVRVEGGREVERVEGWDRGGWERLDVIVTNGGADSKGFGRGKWRSCGGGRG